MGCKETNHKTEYRTPHSPHLRPAGAKWLLLPIKGGSPVIRKHKPKPVPGRKLTLQLPAEPRGPPASSLVPAVPTACCFLASVHTSTLASLTLKESGTKSHPQGRGSRKNDP